MIITYLAAAAAMGGPNLVQSNIPTDPIPTGNVAAWVTITDYPERAIRKKHEGSTGFRLTIEPTGRPSGCVITQSSGWTELDVMTCELLFRRAHFIPAMDADQHPAVGFWSNKLRWSLPKLQPSMPKNEVNG